MIFSVDLCEPFVALCVTEKIINMKFSVLNTDYINMTLCELRFLTFAHFAVNGF
jgi:hypothetical protein